MTPRERAIAALELRQSDRLTTTELNMQLTEEFFGKSHVTKEQLESATESEKERLVWQNAELLAQTAEHFQYGIMPIWAGCHSDDDILATIGMLKKLGGEDKFLIGVLEDGTHGIPNGENMVEYSRRLFDEADTVKAEMKASADRAIERGKRLADNGAEVVFMCADYCFNDGPFLSPNMFTEFITPNLHRIIAELRKAGIYAVKHTDGDILPILDQLVSCEPHALHSLDPMAGVDIAEVKKLYGDTICLIGNVNCALMQTGTDEEVIESAKYCIGHASPGGGYIFSTSNVVFKGLPKERYQLILDVLEEYNECPVKNPSGTLFATPVK